MRGRDRRPEEARDGRHGRGGDRGGRLAVRRAAGAAPTAASVIIPEAFALTSEFASVAAAATGADPIAVADATTRCDCRCRCDDPMRRPDATTRCGAYLSRRDERGARRSA